MAVNDKWRISMKNQLQRVQLTEINRTQFK